MRYVGLRQLGGNTPADDLPILKRKAQMQCHVNCMETETSSQPVLFIYNSNRPDCHSSRITMEMTPPSRQLCNKAADFELECINFVFDFLVHYGSCNVLDGDVVSGHEAMTFSVKMQRNCSVL